jgi:hypothetical protein
MVPVPMSETAVRAPRAASKGDASATPLRIAFLGTPVWLDCCAPTAPAQGLVHERFDLPAGADIERTLAGVDAFAPDATVILDPAALFAQSGAPSAALLARGAPSATLSAQSGARPSLEDGLGGPTKLTAQALRAVGGTTLGVLVGGLPEGGQAGELGALDRLVTFDPALTGARVGTAKVWRAMPPAVADTHFKEVRPLRHSPNAISIGRSTPHREAMLMPAKHEHDLLQVLHGVSGAMLAELLGEYDAGVYIAPEAGAGFGWQVGAHLAAGQLLLSGTLAPLHGLERGLDYLEIDSPASLVWVLDRLGRFPEMYQRIRVRGRLKAEQYRASRLFARIAHDLLADVAAFGSAAA